MRRAWLNRLLALVVAMGPAATFAAQVCKLTILPSSPSYAFTVAGDGTAVDEQTKLKWKRCSEGQTWDGATCTGAPATYTWRGALARAKAVNDSGGYAGRTDWRVPNVQELNSLVEEQCYAPAINATVFPATASDPVFWSATPMLRDPNDSDFSHALIVGFWVGGSGPQRKGDRNMVRLVTNAIPSVPSAGLQSAASRKRHGTAGDFDLVLSLNATNPTIEPRARGAGLDHTIVFTFGATVTSGNAAVTTGTAIAGVPTFSGSEMRVPLSGVANAQYVTVAVSNVALADGTTGSAGAARIGFLLGDVNGSRSVTLSDALWVNAVLTQPVTSTTYLRDVNLSGTLSLSDNLAIKANLTQTLPAP